MIEGALTPTVLFAARKLLGWKRRELAKRMSVPQPSIRTYEVDGVVTAEFDLEIAHAIFEAEGVEFVEEKCGGTGVRLRKTQK